MIHLLGAVVLSALLAALGVYGLLARRSAVLVLIGAELLLNAANVLFVAFAALPAGGLATPAGSAPALGEPLLGGQVMAVYVITVAAAEIGLALAVVLLLFRTRETSDLDAVRELGEAAPAPRVGSTPPTPAPAIPTPGVAP